MAITNASRVADFGSGIGTEGAVLQIDNTNERIGIGTTNPQAMLQVGTGVTVYGNSGIVSATTFFGNLTGDVTGDASGSSGSCTGNAATATLATNASGLSGSPDITINNLVGVAATFSGVITYEDVTNVDSLGIITARGGFEIGAAGVGGTITSVGNAEFAGITTASKFSGPGNIPGPSQSGTVTLAASDAGKFVSATSGGVTLPASTLAVGEGITIYNNHSGDITLTCSAPTAVYLGTDGSTKTSITLATRCICTFFCVDASSSGTYVCIGGGIS